MSERTGWRGGLMLLLPLLALAGCEATTAPIARSCSDPFSEGDPCEGTFRCNLDCRTAMDGYGYSCWFGTIMRSHNDCGMVRDAGGLTIDCRGPLYDGALCAGAFECHTACPSDGMPAFACATGRLVRVTDPCGDAGPPDADAATEDAATEDTGIAAAP